MLLVVLVYDEGALLHIEAVSTRAETQKCGYPEEKQSALHASSIVDCITEAHICYARRKGCLGIVLMLRAGQLTSVYYGAVFRR